MQVGDIVVTRLWFFYLWKDSKFNWKNNGEKQQQTRLGQVATLLQLTTYSRLSLQE
jgi:hypothetical protein